MALQTGMGLSKIIILAGAGYTGTIMLNNGKLADLLGELQNLLKNGDQENESGGDVVKLLDRMAKEVERLRNASSGQITVLNGSSGGINATSLIMPAATFGALGYGYMWWKGLSFSDLMYVTKKNMTAAVSNLNKHLETVTEALSVAKKHLTQRIQNLSDKVEKTNELAKDIKKSVGEACEDLSKVEENLRDLQGMIYGLDGKIDSLGYKQDITNIGMYYLCNFVAGRDGKMPENIQDQFNLGVKARGLLKASSSPMGLKEITDSLSENTSQSGRDTIEQDGINNLNNQQRLPLRANSTLY